MNKIVVISQGENQHLTWKDTLSEDNKFIIYKEWAYSKEIYLGPSSDDDIENVIKIKKDQLRNLSFTQIELLLKNLESNKRLKEFCKFLENKKINYDYQIW